MVQHFAHFASVKFKVSMRESDESDACNENQEIRIVTLTLRFKRIITKLVAIRFVVHVVFFFESMSMRIRCENVVVTNVKKKNLLKQSKIVVVTIDVVKLEMCVLTRF